jgi:hypothetical protein
MQATMGSNKSLICSTQAYLDLENTLKNYLVVSYYTLIRYTNRTVHRSHPQKT